MLGLFEITLRAAKRNEYGRPLGYFLSLLFLPLHITDEQQVSKTSPHGNSGQVFLCSPNMGPKICKL